MTNVSRVLAIFRQEEAGKGEKTTSSGFGNIPGTVAPRIEFIDLIEIQDALLPCFRHGAAD